MNLYTTLQALCGCASVSGREKAIRSLLTERILPFCDEIREDALGNLIARKKGSGEGPSVMLCAHMDEIGSDKIASPSGGSGFICTAKSDCAICKRLLFSPPLLKEPLPSKKSS